MTEAEDLLNSTETDSAASTDDTGAEEHIVVGADRIVTVPAALKKIAVQYDHNIETVTFDCPRYWDGRDMSTMRAYINYKRSDGYMGCYLCPLITVDETDSNIMHFDWIISRGATGASGVLRFLVCIKRTDTDGNEIEHWNSDLNSEMYVSEGLECSDSIVKSNPDVIEQILAKIESLGSSGGSGDSLLSVVTISTSSGSDNIPVESITLDYSELSLTAGESMQIAASVAPSNATNNTIVWESSNTSVASVKNGYVTAVGSGNATITAKSAENSSIYAVCAITVSSASGTVKVLLGSLDLIEGLLKKDAATVYSSIANTWHVEIPYIDGMVVSTALNAGWVGNYPPVFVKDGDTITVAETTTVSGTPANVTASYIYNATLTGFSENAKVYVNIYAAGSGNVTLEEAMNSSDVYWYTYEV